MKPLLLALALILIAAIAMHVGSSAVRSWRSSVVARSERLKEAER